MSTSKHTPGPWEAVEGESLNPERPWAIQRYHEGDEPTTETIAEVCPAGPPEVAEADARLIAAAPELYEALEALLADSLRSRAVLADLAREGHRIAQARLEDAEHGPNGDAHASARAALAKARGEEA